MLPFSDSSRLVRKNFADQYRHSTVSIGLLSTLFISAEPHIFRQNISIVTVHYVYCTYIYMYMSLIW